MPNSQAIFPFPPPNPVAHPPNNESQYLVKANGAPDSESGRSAKLRVQHKIQPLLPLQPVQSSHVSTLDFPRQSPQLTASGRAQTFPCSQTIPPLALDEPDLTTDSAVILSPSPSFDGNIRKKSGEPLKSSLKCRTPTPRPSLAVVTGKLTSKSEPGTPHHIRSKSVSFAERLDHVKLFFAEQKPIAVSRDGSPTEESGTESEAPAPIHRASSDDEKKRLLVMEVINMPQRWTMDVDVMLEDVALSKEATICGHVKVRNLAFQKSVAVRFTFDFWQTTSEVSAKYEQPLAHGAFDRFSFVIRLHDILSKIEDKTLFMAIRYTVNGREIWDNNWGNDYKIKFSLPAPTKSHGAIAQIQYASDEEAVANLTKKLQHVQSTEALKDAQRFHRRRGSGSAGEDFFFSSSTSLSSRYTWEASLKKPWKPADYPTPSHPPSAPQPASSSVFPWSRKPNQSPLVNQRHSATRSQVIDTTRGSPRFGDENTTPEIATRLLPGSFRNHIRGSFDVRSPSGLADTGSPDGKKFKAVFDLVPPRDKAGGGTGATDADNDGETLIPISQVPKFHMPGEIERTSSDDSCSSSVSSSSQPSPTVIAASTSSKEMASIINRFCFYTSSGSETRSTVGSRDDGGVLGLGGTAGDGASCLAAAAEALMVPEEVLQRSHSASSIEDILRQVRRTTSQIEHPESPHKSRRSSCDDLASLGGALTPTHSPTTMPFRL
ncbi:putative phosphatase regulatory subunit-domain-containing protein [Thelephora terrestris]|uniref:Phosphatase regulatory subunit-domain-containing protein n=1 Tax=Thelephora terrestris TaxID=56493 RepID=A0A9P6LD64_9AGAM|nr:putative phosphatase regulatory subunit-domain-containing protein [Thelephora terrestris]